MYNAATLINIDPDMIGAFASRQPTTLYAMTASYMCENFGYYMLRTLLVLYMINLLMIPTAAAYSTFAAYSALMYVAPLVGGKFIDRNFDNDHAALGGGVLLAAGLCMLGYFGQHYLNLALSMIICGKGFYEPGIIATLGQLYPHGDTRRGSGFLSIYSGINISAAAASISAPIIMWRAGWAGAFYTAAAITLFGTLLLYVNRWWNSELKKITAEQQMEFILFAASGAIVFTILLRSISMSMTFMIGLSAAIFIYTLFSLIKLNFAQRKQILFCLALTSFALICFILIQQSALSLTVFAEHHVQRVLNGKAIPTFYFLALNPLFIVMLTPILASVWNGRNRDKNNETIAKKFGLGAVLLGIGFLILTTGLEWNENSTEKLNLWWLVTSYFFQTLGELFIIPVGLAMITDLAPHQMTGFMIGAWYFAMATASWLAGVVANHTIILHHPSSHHHISQALTAYANVFGTLGFAALISGMMLILLTQFISYIRK